MKNFDHYLADAGYYDIADIPQQYKYYAYKAGECSVFKLVAEARKFSGNIEKVCVNTEEAKACRNARQEAEGRAQTAWLADLRGEYQYLSDAVFNACYAEAYEDGYSAGYDEVRNCMVSVVDFAEKILQLK